MKTDPENDQEPERTPMEAEIDIDPNDTTKPMRLKQLELHGYKTFAGKTNFHFKGGLTAIVGPNGSGKSNISDAIQWVLGEQSFTRLRAKRSEDMIFSGSNERARLGMAQASLTLDNTDGWLAVDYGEVVITRRAYRSGENEYYLNGTRVRLKDINQLLSQSGLAKRTYTMIGQGLVDQALSLRPDERRALLEEAAGITGHQAKRDTALRQLAETRRNLERVRDILNEIEPRLRYLKTQATRAEKRFQVQADLDTQLRVWYGYRWNRSRNSLALAREEETSTGAVVKARQETLRQLDGQHTTLRERHAFLRNKLGDWHRASSTLHRQAEAMQRELAVGSERKRQLAERRDDLLAELDPMQERRQAQVEHVQVAQAALSSEQENLQQLESRIQEAQAGVDAAEATRRRHGIALADAQKLASELQTEQIGYERSLVEQEGRRQTLVAEITRLEEELQASVSRHQEFLPQVASLEAQLSQLEAEGQTLAEQRGTLVQAIDRNEAQSSEWASQLAQGQRRADRLRDQLELLQRLKDEGEGYGGGARSVLRGLGSSSSELSGIIGTVADQIDVPERLELAIETALGGRLQDIVVDRWQDAEKAIAWLKRTSGGRATFLPLDTIRPGRPISVPSGAGVIGVGADLVKADPQLGQLVDYLLGRVVVTENLAVARRVRGAGQNRPTIVTLEGDIVRPGGSVSGGSRAARRDKGVLARERSLRELPQALRQAEKEVSEQQAQLAALQQAIQDQRQSLNNLDHELADASRQQQTQTAALAKLQGQATQIAQELDWRNQRLSQAHQEQEGLSTRKLEAQTRISQLAEAIQEAQLTVTEAERELTGLDPREMVADLMEQRSAASVVAARVASEQAILSNQQRSLNQLQQEIRFKQARADGLVAEQEALAARLGNLQLQDETLGAQIDEYANRIDPAEKELSTIDTERNALAEEESQHRRHLQYEEQISNKAQLALQRATDELTHLRSEIEHDVGLVELDEPEQVDSQPPLPIRPIIERLPVIEELPERVEKDIRKLRSQYNRLGSVNPNAPEEYQEARDRHEFLTGQATDLEQAADTLEEVIQELNEVMQREFMVTFQAVAREFKEKFTTLFGGGTARLELNEPDDPMHSGIEIIARPPGKRTMALPLLSGGERSLTAAALILSILEVSPPPFCILDEVDAALDEANVNRFRAAIKEAAKDLQFIIITHNRGTIEAADTIYGISMGSDSSSQALSLHLEDLDSRRERYQPA
ncbi:MAG: chromosome segregation protein SMC [Chloroflexota bacterium]|nr:chromosome segregation protein SMC [Chloroflexota bacterium]